MSNSKNVETLEILISDCSGLGGYNPGSPNLSIQSLTSKLINAKQAVDDANVAKSNLNRETNNREVAFDALPKLASSIIFTMSATGASEQTLNDARFILRQLTGRKRSKKTAPVATAPTANDTTGEQGKISRVPQTSYVSKADHFGNLVKLVSAEPSYAANEPELSVTGLNEKLVKIQQLNSNVIQAKSRWNDKKMARDKILNNSLVQTGRSVQKYVRAVYGLHSAAYRTIGKLSFNKSSQ